MEKVFSFKEIQKIAKDIEEIWENYYYSKKKYDLIQNYIEKNNLKHLISIKKKAISTHLKTWLGWKGIYNNYTETQFRLRFYGGYVIAIIFNENYIKDLPKHQKRG